MRLADAKAAASKAPDRFVVIEPSAYASTWRKTPKGPERVGLCLLGADEIVRAREIAAQAAWKKHPHQGDLENRIDAHNDVLITTLVARGTCSTVNVEAPFWPGAEDNIPVMLRPEAIRFLYDAIEQYTIETSPFIRPAAGEDLVELAERIARPDALARLDRIERLRCGKLLAYVLEEIRRGGGETTASEST